MGTKITTTVRVYAELNDFLPKAQRGQEIHCVSDPKSVKDLIERLGVPHPEIDLILVNGESASFERIVGDGDLVSVFPVFESFDIADVTRVRPAALRELRFAADAHLGKLAILLRLLGFDTLYRNDWADEDLAWIAAEERRVVLTRDRGLLKRAAIERGYCVRNDARDEQLVEVVQRFDLSRSARPFSRCSRCNSAVVPVAKVAIADQLPPMTRKYYDEFQRCEGCGQIYWEGAHRSHILQLLNRALDGRREGR